VPKILIADDNTNIQKMVALAFQERGIQVVAVGNGEAAVRRLADLSPDLVLADIFMPVRSGYEVCEYIKKDQRFSHIPVILLVGAFDPLDEKEARRVGADGVLKKPFVPPDPLIAMVTAVLEKNPRVAAELAKAKEIVAEPPPLPEPVIAAVAEPKPLPEFPEPTPEEAAMLYGFGSGRHSILEEEKDREEEIEPVEAGIQEEDFEGAETTRDWRRAAMDFEVPQEVGGRPAFSDEAGAFPSERDVPGRHIRVSDSQEVTQPVIPVVEDHAFDSASAPVSAPEVASETLAPEPSASLPSPLFVAPFAASLAAPSTTIEQSSTQADREPETLPAEHGIQPEPSAADSGFTSNVPHWMDALSAEPSGREWMASLLQKQEEPKKFEEAAGTLALQEAPLALVTGTRTEDDVEKPAPRADALIFPSSQSSNGRDTFFVNEPANESWFAPVPAAFDAPLSPTPDWIARPADANMAASNQHAELVEPAGVRVTPEALLEADETDFAASGSQRAPGLVESAGVRVTPEPLLEADETDVAASVSKRDPYLVEPPAVHVTPEPLLDLEESQVVTQVDSHMEELAPTHSLVVPEPVEPIVEPAVIIQRDEPHGENLASAAESSVEEFSERIPTGPPPSREALAEIPFLTPPPDFHPNVRGEAELSDETLDAVVQRVLERLEPQLHQLLSEGVLKPLVENLLHGELAKKNR